MAIIFSRKVKAALFLWQAQVKSVNHENQNEVELMWVVLRKIFKDYLQRQPNNLIGESIEGDVVRTDLSFQEEKDSPG